MTPGVPKSVAAILLACAPLPCAAEPVHLRCHTTFKGDRQDFTVSADESTGKVAHRYTNGDKYAFAAAARFTTTTLNYGVRNCSDGMCIDQRFVIDRTGLGARKTVIVSVGGNSQVSSVAAGSCAVEGKPSRRF